MHVYGYARLDLFSHSQKHVIDNIHSCFFPFYNFSLCLFVSALIGSPQLLTCEWISEWYLSLIFLLLQHIHLYRIASFCFSTAAPPGIILSLPPCNTYIQPGEVTAVHSLPPPPVSDSHDLGRPSATAQIWDQLTARWLDLNIQRAGGLSIEVSLQLPLQHRFYNSSVSHFLFCTSFVQSSGSHVSWKLSRTGLCKWDMCCFFHNISWD